MSLYEEAFGPSYSAESRNLDPIHLGGLIILIVETWFGLVWSLINMVNLAMNIDLFCFSHIKMPWISFIVKAISTVGGLTKNTFSFLTPSPIFFTSYDTLYGNTITNAIPTFHLLVGSKL